MTSDRDKNPYLPPKSRETPVNKTPGPAAIFLIGIASIAAGVFAFFGTCYGVVFGMVTIESVVNSSPAWVALILAVAGIFGPIMAAFFTSRSVRRRLTARFTEQDN